MNDPQSAPAESKSRNVITATLLYLAAILIFLTANRSLQNAIILTSIASAALIAAGSLSMRSRHPIFVTTVCLATLALMIWRRGRVEPYGFPLADLGEYLLLAGTIVSSGVMTGKGLFARFLSLILVFTFFALMVEGGTFFTPRNLESILRQSCVYATAGLGMTMVIIAAGIDLSAGSLIALSLIAVSWVLNFNVTGANGQAQPLADVHPTLAPLLALIAGVMASTLAGLANGGMIVGLRLIPFIVTLGTMGMIRGVAKGIAHERDIYPPTTWLNTIMDPTLTNPNRSWMILPPGVWMCLVGVLFSVFLLRYTRLGRHIFAIGSNEETARLCGVPVGRTKLFVYTASGFFCGVAGLMQFSFISGIGQPTSAVMYELSIIAAVIIGGASFNGGEGSILGTLLGALLITVLNMGGKQMGWDEWIQETVISGMIIVAVAFDQLRHRKRT